MRVSGSTVQKNSQFVFNEAQFTDIGLGDLGENYECGRFRLKTIF